MWWKLCNLTMLKGNLVWYQNLVMYWWILSLSPYHTPPFWLLYLYLFFNCTSLSIKISVALPIIFPSVFQLVVLGTIFKIVLQECTLHYYHHIIKIMVHFSKLQNFSLFWFFKYLPQFFFDLFWTLWLSYNVSLLSHQVFFCPIKSVFCDHNSHIV